MVYQGNVGVEECCKQSNRDTVQVDTFPENVAVVSMLQFGLTFIEHFRIFSLKKTAKTKENVKDKTCPPTPKKEKHDSVTYANMKDLKDKKPSSSPWRVRSFLSLKKTKSDLAVNKICSLKNGDR